jgi:hypothetical protein
MSWLVIWRMGSDLDFMRDEEETVSEFDDEAEAERAAERSPASNQFNYTVVEAP